MFFLQNIDPTALNRQFNDAGTQYRTGVFFHNEAQRRLAESSKTRLEQSGKFDAPIVPEISPASTFYPAEIYHQEYYKKNEVHYQMYKQGSGRAQYLKTVWDNS